MNHAKILIVCDEQNIREYLTNMLTNRGYDVIEAESGDAALRILKGEEQPDLILLNILVHGIATGIQFLEIIRKDKKTCCIPVIILTVLAIDEALVMRTGADDFVRKIKDIKSRWKSNDNISTTPDRATLLKIIRIRKLGVDGVLMMPVDLRALFARIEALLRRTKYQGVTDKIL